MIRQDASNMTVFEAWFLVIKQAGLLCMPTLIYVWYVSCPNLAESVLSCMVPFPRRAWHLAKATPRLFVRLVIVSGRVFVHFILREFSLSELSADPFGMEEPGFEPQTGLTQNESPAFGRHRTTRSVAHPKSQGLQKEATPSEHLPRWLWHSRDSNPRPTGLRSSAVPTVPERPRYLKCFPL